MNKAVLHGLMCLVCLEVFAQDDLMQQLEKEQSQKTNYTIQTFSGSRIVNSHSVETRGKGELEFIFSHRFGRLNSGSYNFWGLDNAFVRLGLEYGLTDRLGISVGRTSVDKTFDGYVKYKVLRQNDEHAFLPTITAIASGYIKTSPQAKFNPQVQLNDRLAYAFELLIARKLTPNFSLQLEPIFVHRNEVIGPADNKDDFALGLGARHKITRSLALSGDYFYRVNKVINSSDYDAIGLGVDIETGGHVFQLVFTNSLGMFTRAVVSETQGDFFDGDIHFGFNITRNFQLIHPK